MSDNVGIMNLNGGPLASSVFYPGLADEPERTELLPVSVVPWESVPSREEMLPPQKEEGAEGWKPYVINTPVDARIKNRYTVYTKSGTKLRNGDLAKHIAVLTDAIIFNRELFFRDENGVYTRDQDLLDKIINWHYPNSTANERKEVRLSLRFEAREVVQAPPELAAFQGKGCSMQVVNLVTHKIVPPEERPKNLFFLNIIPHAVPVKDDGTIDMDYTDPVAEQFLNSIACNDAEVLAQLEEMLGYPVYRANRFKVMHIMKGDGNNGKTVLVNAIRHMLGEENCSNLNVDNLGDKFMTSELIGKLCNLTDDMTDDFLGGRAAAVLKSVTSESTLALQRKFENPFAGRSYAKLIIASNEILNISDRAAIADRLLYIPLRGNFSKGSPDRDPAMPDKVLQESAQQGLLIHALRGIFRLLENGGEFTTTMEAQEVLKETRINGNCVLGWLEYVSEENISICDAALDDEYRSFKEWCEDNGVRPVKKAKWSKDVLAAGYEKKQRKIPDRYNPNVLVMKRTFVPRNGEYTAYYEGSSEGRNYTTKRIRTGRPGTSKNPADGSQEQ